MPFWGTTLVGQNTKTWPAVATLLLNAAIFGLAWWPFREIDALGLHSLWTTALMYLIAATGLLIWQPGVLAMVARRRGLWVLAIAAGLTNAAFNWGVLIGEVIRVVLLFYLMPVWAALLARMFLAEPITAVTVGRIAAAVGGAMLVLWQPGLGIPWPGSLGDWLGLAGGLCFAATNIALKRYADEPPQARAMAMFIGGLALPGLLALVLDASLVPWPAHPVGPWLIPSIGLTVIFIVANLCLQYGASRLPANVTSVIMISEVVFASASAILIGGEQAGWRTGIGAAMIVGAALAAAWSAQQRARGRSMQSQSS
ncbi:MAG: DMT family transporter [Burkholderiaceae bacterium]